MNIRKIQGILKNKKVKIIATSLAGVLVLTLAGTILLHNKSIENKSIAIEKENKKDVNKEKKEAKEKLEELKKIDTSKLSNEEKKDLENKIADVEKKVVNNDNPGSSEEVTSSNSSSESSSLQTSSNSRTSNSTQNSGTTTSSKPSTDSSSLSSKPSIVVSSSSSSSQTHSHSWNPITTTIHHDEVGHNEDILVSAAWTEEIPNYEEREVLICNGCGADITANPTTHNKNHMLNGERGGWSTEYRQIQVGTNKINHEAVYEKKWVVDKAAWDETVTTGYKCSSCGETK